jgi:hypothetical protein
MYRFLIMLAAALSLEMLYDKSTIGGGNDFHHPEKRNIAS